MTEKTLLENDKKKQIRFLDFIFLFMELWAVFWLFEILAYLFSGNNFDITIIIISLLGFNIYILYGLTLGVVSGIPYFIFKNIKSNREQEKIALNIIAAIFIFSIMFMHAFDLIQRNAGIKFSNLKDAFTIIGIVSINFLFAIVIYLFLQKIYYKNKQGTEAISLSICFAALIAVGYIINNHFLSEILSWQSYLINIVFLLSIVILYFLLNRFLKIINRNKKGKPFYLQRPAYFILLMLCLLSWFALILLGNYQIAQDGECIQNIVQNKRSNNLSNSANVILITMDALRYDHLSCYGYRDIETPSIDSIAERGVLFSQAISQSSWTTPSFASMLTSHYPSVHDGGRILCEIGNNLKTEIIQEIPMLPEILQEQGYSTGAFISNFNLASTYGFSRGFDDYFNFDHKTMKNEINYFLFIRNWRNLKKREYDYKHGKTRSRLLTEKAMEWIESHAKNPFFLWIHYIDPHLPYEGYKESEVFNKPVYNDIRDKMDTLLSDAFSNQIRNGTLNLNSLEKRLLIELYDEEITETDTYIGKLLEKVRALDLEDKTLIVFASDHGEEFFDHHNFEHGHSLFDEVIRVPLIFQYHEIPQNIVDKQVRAIDIMPSILEILNISCPDDISGRSLVPLMKSHDDNMEIPPAISEFMLYFEERKSLRTEDFKLVFYPESKDTELYNLKKDPLELSNINTTNPEVSKMLFERLDSETNKSLELKAYLTKGKGSNVVKPDKMLMEHLKALGYINPGSNGN